VVEVTREVAPGRGRHAPGLVLVVLGAAAMSFSVLQSLVIPVLPAIGQDLRVSQEAATWVLTGYLLSAAVATPLLGRLGDMFGTAVGSPFPPCRTSSSNPCPPTRPAWPPG
jgi:MFS family permease